MASALAKGGCDLFLRMAKPIHQLAIACRLIHWVEVGPLNILDDRHFQNFGIGEIADNDRDVVQLSDLRRAPATLPRHNLISV